MKGAEAVNTHRK